MTQTERVDVSQASCQCEGIWIEADTLASQHYGVLQHNMITMESRRKQYSKIVKALQLKKAK